MQFKAQLGAAVRQNESLEFIWNGKYDYNYKYCISRHKLSLGDSERRSGRRKVLTQQDDV